MTAPLDNAIGQCLETLRRHDRDRYLLHLFAPSRHRHVIVGLFAFNAEISRTRDAVSEPQLGLIRLQWWRDAIAGLHPEAQPPHEILQILRTEILTTPALCHGMLALIDSRERDLDDTPFADLAALRAYIAATAGTLTETAMRIGNHEPSEIGLEAARHSALAFGLSGIALAVPYQVRTGRRMLPTDMMAAAGLRRDDLRPDRTVPGLDRVLHEIAGEAERELELARALRRDVPTASLPVLLEASIADQRLRRLRGASFDPYALSERPAGSMLPLRLAWNAWRGTY
jgi:NADH dehydrogenase [ubiquinone] 1 alpha subcomplex assembly factor 6